jgi:hypothetical protein
LPKAKTGMVVEFFLSWRKRWWFFHFLSLVS